MKVIRGKTNAAIRRIPLSEKAIQILSARMKRFDGKFLFPQNDIDGEKPARSLNASHLKTVRKLGFNFWLFDTRHTFATRCLESGVDLLVLSALLGHENLKMDSRYAHPSEKHKADAIRQMQLAKTG